MPYARNDKQINLLGTDNVNIIYIFFILSFSASLTSNLPFNLQSDSSDSNEDGGGKENAAFPGNLDYSEGRRKKHEPPPTLLKSPRRW